MAYSDDIAGAPDITSGGGDWDNLTATDGAGEPLNVADSQFNVWQKVFLADPGTYLFGHDTVPAGDTVMTIYTGPSAATYADLVSVGTGDDQGGHNKPLISYRTAGGEWIYIESTGYLGERLSGQSTFFQVRPDPAPGWVDMSSGVFFRSGWAADLGEYLGPWPIMWPPDTNPDGGSDGLVFFYVMLPNPADPTDPTLVGDGSYASYVYQTYIENPGRWTDGSWSNFSVGGAPTPPLPPELQPGAHLYVQIFETEFFAPSMTPASLVPASYGGTNPREWSPGGWSTIQPGADEAGPASAYDPFGSSSGYVNSLERTGVIFETEHVTGFTNDLGWATITGLTFEAFSWPPKDLSLLSENLDADVATKMPSTGNAPTGSFMKLTAMRHYYDPGDALGIKAVDGGVAFGPGDGPFASIQTGQHHQGREVGVNPRDLPAFFDTGGGTVWFHQPWSGNVMDPLTDPYPTFDDTATLPLSIAGYAAATGVPPLFNPPDQIIDFYGRQTAVPLTSDPSNEDGRIDEISNYVWLASITASFDWTTGLATFPTTIDLPLGAIPQIATGRNLGIEIMTQPRTLSSGGITVINTPEIDHTTVPNGGEIKQIAEYDIDCDLASTNFPWTIHWAAFSYWQAGQIVPSSPRWHTVGGHWATVGPAGLKILTPLPGGSVWVDVVDGPA